MKSGLTNNKEQLCLSEGSCLVVKLRHILEKTEDISCAAGNVKQQQSCHRWNISSQGSHSLPVAVQERQQQTASWLHLFRSDGPLEWAAPQIWAGLWATWWEEAVKERPAVTQTHRGEKGLLLCVLEWTVVHMKALDHVWMLLSHAVVLRLQDVVYSTIRLKHGAGWTLDKATCDVICWCDCDQGPVCCTNNPAGRSVRLQDTLTEIHQTVCRMNEEDGDQT